MTGADRPDRPLAIKIPEWQTATLFSVAALAMFLSFYIHMQGFLRVLCFLAGFMAGIGAIVSYRAYLVVDEDGIGARGWFREKSVDWPDLRDLDVASHRGALTVQVRRQNGSKFDVPPALLLPLKPTSRDRTIAQLEQLIRQIQAYAPPGLLQD